MDFSRSVLGLARQAAVTSALLAWLLTGAAASEGAKSNEQAMAAYADAANFQTNGAIELAIEAWKKYLQDHPEASLAANAWHYLGVCYMQQPEPDFELAAEAFAKATQDPQAELRQESLVNLGWCQFAAAGEGEQRDPERLKSALQAFKTLIKEQPSGKFADRAFFYAGEAASGLGEHREAVFYYDQLLALESNKPSPLRCDTFYARGVALESLQRHDDAVASYRQLLENCQDSRLLNDARVRIGDLHIAQQQYDQAIRQFAEVAKTEGADQPYALLRQAFALVQSERAAEASALYEQLVQDHPESPYAPAAMLASAQAAYRASDLDLAATRFERVLEQSDAAAATEAAHWLAMISLRKGDAEAAAKIAQRQLDAGPAGPYAATLRMALAEATMQLPDKTAEAMRLYRELYESDPAAPEAPRALYNAAFAAMQLGQHAQAAQWAEDFLQRYSDDPLEADVRYIRAECKLMSGAAEQAAQEYQRLLERPAPKHQVQRPLWVLRAATALSLADQPDAAIALLEKHREDFADATQQAEAAHLTGMLHLRAGRGSEAVQALEQALAAKDWPRAGEAKLQLGQAHLAAGEHARAAEVWQQLVDQAGVHSNHARYRLAQLAARQGEHDQAAERFEQLLAADPDPSLVPLALYGRGWNLMRADNAAEALKTLDRLIAQHADHPAAADAKLARGMCLRALGKSDEAAEVLESYLASDPQGANRGHALYELALIDQQRDRAAQAAERLEQLVAAVPDYPDLQNVLYEWAWSLKESGQDDAAQQRFEQLIEQYPDAPLAAEAHYFIGQRHYSQEDWQAAAKSYAAAAKLAADPELEEKATFRRGWALYQAADYPAAITVFAAQIKQFPEGDYLPDALLMVGEGHFRSGAFEPARQAYEVARKRILENDETQQQFSEVADRQIRELVFLHGGQSLAQLKQWEQAIEWFKQLEERFADSQYLPQARYETAFARQQLGEEDAALRLYEQVAAEQRNELGARARFMIGEIHFGRGNFDAAIPEFQRVMYGYGAEKAPESIRNWQAKSGFEAARCAELLLQNASDPQRRQKSAEIAAGFFRYVVEKHPQHELVAQSQERLKTLAPALAGASQPPNRAPRPVQDAR